MNILKSKLTWIGVTILVLLVTAPFWQERIDSTTQGIMVDTWEKNSEGLPKVRPVSGWVPFNPIRYDVIEYPGEYQQVQDTYTFFSEGLPVDVTTSIYVRPERMKAGKIYQQYRLLPKELNDKLVKDLLNKSVKRAGENTENTDIGNFTLFREKMIEALEEMLPAENLEFRNVIINDIDLPKEISDAARKTLAAQQQIDQERQQTLLQAERNKRELIEQQGVTALTIERAKAEAVQLDEISSELNDKLLRKMWIEKWNGQLPSTMTGKDMSILLGNK